MEKLNFSSFENVSEKDKKILNALYKLLYKKFNINSSYTWDIINYLRTKINDKQLPLYDLAKYVYILRFNAPQLTSNYFYPKAAYDIEEGIPFGQMGERVFKTLLNDIVKKENVLNSIKNCFANKILFTYQPIPNVLPNQPTEIPISFDSNSVELDKVFPFWTVILQFDRFLKGFFMEIEYDKSKEGFLNVKLHVGDIVENLSVPTFLPDIRKPNENDFVKFICKDLTPYYIETIKKYISSNQ